MDKLDNKVAVVSGAARGQGRSHAVTLAGQGASIIALDICADIEGNTYPLSRREDLDETARLIEKEGVRVDTIVVDVRDRTAVWKAVADGVAALVVRNRASQNFSRAGGAVPDQDGHGLRPHHLGRIC